jgi:octaprenyl-diphosphate synthase
MEKGKMTLPLIHFLRSAPQEHGMLLRSLLGGRDADKVERIRNLIVPSQSIGYAQGRAREYAQRARKAIAPLGECEAKEALEAMAGFVVSRRV